MIVSHQHRFIFLKTMKTAGTSVEIALSRFCGPDDIITRITDSDEETRRALGYRGPQNDLAPEELYTPQDWQRRSETGEPKRRFFNHTTARAARAFLGEAIWDDYYKFCIERNPWDKVISLYYWRCQSEPRPTIAEYLASDDLLLLKRGGWQTYTLDGQVVVDRICRYENLGAELETVRQRLGLPNGLELPHTKSHTRKDKRPYTEILGEAEKIRIAELFRDEIELLGYQF